MSFSRSLQGAWSQAWAELESLVHHPIDYARAGQIGVMGPCQFPTCPFTEH